MSEHRHKGSSWTCRVASAYRAMLRETKKRLGPDWDKNERIAREVRARKEART